MRKAVKGLLLMLVALALLVSCKSAEPLIETRYVSVPVDISSSMELVISTRPETSFDLIEDIQTVADIMANSMAYQTAWERWQDYAFRLEDYLTILKEVLSSSDNE